MLINKKSPKVQFAQRIDEKVLKKFVEWKKLYRKKTGNSVDTSKHIEELLVKLTETIKSDLNNKSMSMSAGYPISSMSRHNL